MSLFDIDLVRTALEHGQRQAWISPSWAIQAGGGEGLPDKAGPEMGELVRFVEQVEDARAGAEYSRQSCQRLVDRDQHGEWHHYEMAASHHASTVRNARLEMAVLGWIGLELDNDEATPRLRVRGSQEALQAAHEDLAILAIEGRWNLEVAPYLPRDLARIVRRRNPPTPLREPGPDGRCMDDEAEERWFQAVASLSNLGNGWLDSEGVFLACSLHDHLKVMGDQEDFDELYVEVEKLEKRLADKRARLTRERSMHRTGTAAEKGLITLQSKIRETDTALLEAKTTMIGEVYSAGWVRLGTYDNAGQPTLQAEGSKGALKRTRHILVGLAQSMGAELSATVPGGEPEMPQASRPGPGRR